MIRSRSTKGPAFASAPFSHQHVTAKPVRHRLRIDHGVDDPGHKEAEDGDLGKLAEVTRRGQQESVQHRSF